jgi:hypothetical protein
MIKTTLTTKMWTAPLAAMMLVAPAVSMLPGAHAAHAQRTSSMRSRVTLSEGQQIQLRLADDLRSNGSRVGQEVRFFTTRAVTGPNGQVLIPRNARAGGHVTEVRRAKRLARKGVVNFSVDYVIAADGTRVPLRAQKVASSNNRGRRGAIAGAAVLLSPAALLVRGRNITVKQGTIFNAYIDRRAQIRPS